MIKRLSLFILLSMSLSCEGLEKQAQANNKAFDLNESKEGMRSGYYFKDTRTDLCFFVIRHDRSVSATCVPCEALKSVKVYTR
jgi:hypothetical protein